MQSSISAATLLLRIRHRNCCDEALCVRVLRIPYHLCRSARFHEQSVVQHQDTIRQPVHDCEIVTDEKTGETELRLQLFEDREDLLLNRHVERRCRLIRNQQFRPEYERPCDRRCCTGTRSSPASHR